MKKFVAKRLKSGWIRVYRSLVDWKLYKDSNTTHLFLHLMLCAEYTGVDRGTFTTTVRELAFDTGLSVQNVRTCLKKLVGNGDIEVTAEHNKTVIKLLSWDRYQIPTKEAIYLFTNTDHVKYAAMIEQYELEYGTEPTQDVLRQFKILCQKEPAAVPPPESK